MISILIVDDSPTDIAILKYLFESEDDIKVIGVATNGDEAVNMVKKFKPNLVTMDLHMPTLDGFQAINRIMAENPVPIVVISSVLGESGLNATFRALEAGALYVMDKPQNITSPEFNKSRRFMIDTIRSMATIKVFRKNKFATPQKNPSVLSKPNLLGKKYDILAIGASVGGPQALTTILSALPADFPLPIVLVQHMSKGFINGFTTWLGGKVKLRVKCADHLEKLSPGTIYVAPDDLHLQIMRQNDAYHANLITGDPVSGFLPSITVMMKSVAAASRGNAVGLLLTGMGNDGAQGMLELKKSNAYTIIQGPESSVVFGMAAVAKNLGAVDEIIELDLIAEHLIKICKPI